MDTKDLYIVDGMGKFSIVAERIISNSKTLEEAQSKMSEMRTHILDKLESMTLEFLLTQA